MSSKDNQIKTQVRIGYELHGKLVLAASKSGRSMNAEILHRLETSFDVPFTPDGYPALSPDLTLGDVAKMFGLEEKK